VFYSYNIELTSLGSEANPVDTVVRLASGVIHQIDILFPVNANRELYVKIYQGGFQICPSNRTGAIQANNTIISTREFFELIPGANTLTIRAWNEHLLDTFYVSVNIGVLPRRILQPFSFKELLAAALGMEEPAGE